MSPGRLSASLTVITALLVGCASTEPPPPRPPPPAPPALSAQAAPAPSASADASAPPPCKAPPAPDVLAATATAPLDAIAVQLDDQGTYVFSPPFARLAYFTLYRDGTLIRFVDASSGGGGLVRAKVAPAEVDALVTRVLGLGFERLCERGKETRKGFVTVTPTDASYTLLRVRLPSGELRQQMVYANTWNEPATAKAIVDHLMGYRPASAIPFVPDKATLYVQAWPGQSRDGCKPADPALASLLARPRPDAFKWAKAVDGPELRGWLGRLPSDGREAVFCTAKQAYRVALFPWLPGADHTAALDAFAKPTQ
jgi:hypothetical protein